MNLELISNITNLLYWLAQFFFILSLIVKRKSAFKKGISIVLIYGIYGTSQELILTPLIDRLGFNLFLGWYLFTIVEHILIALFFYTIFYRSFFKISLLFLSSSFLLFAIYLLFFGSHDKFDSLQSGISAMLVFLYILFHFYEIMNQQSYAIYIYTTPIFWVTTGLLLFFAGNFFLYLYSKDYLNDPSFENTYNIINSFFNSIKFIFITIALYVKPKEMKPLFEN